MLKQSVFDRIRLSNLEAAFRALWDPFVPTTGKRLVSVSKRREAEPSFRQQDLFVCGGRNLC